MWEWDGEWRRTFSFILPPSLRLSFIVIFFTREILNREDSVEPKLLLKYFPSFYPKLAAKQRRIATIPISSGLAAALFPLLTESCVAAEPQLGVKG